MKQGEILLALSRHVGAVFIYDSEGVRKLEYSVQPFSLQTVYCDTGYALGQGFLYVQNVIQQHGTRLNAIPFTRLRKFKTSHMPVLIKLTKPQLHYALC